MTLFSLLPLALFILAGCHTNSPGGAVVSPKTLGTSVDEINLAQENNAELAKLVVYTHEFEINLQEQEAIEVDGKIESGFEYHGPERVRGLRLNPAGQDHVRQIANILQSPYCFGESLFVVVERSQTSKKWQTTHHYPVHYNDELDSVRREIIVSALVALGVENADEIVVVAPAFSTGLSGDEASAAYQRAFQRSRNSSTGRSRFGSF